ncbi:hypothetical protein F2Y49_24915, partial [Bacteroides caccae]
MRRNVGCAGGKASGQSQQGENSDHGKVTLLIEIFYVKDGLAGTQQDTPSGFRIQIKPCARGGEILIP